MQLLLLLLAELFLQLLRLTTSCLAAGANVAGAAVAVAVAAATTAALERSFLSATQAPSFDLCGSRLSPLDGRFLPGACTRDGLN
jgi:hypothetical protein